MKHDIRKQYNNFSTSFSESVKIPNNISRLSFYKSLSFNFKNKKLLDLACGDGQDITEYKKRGAKCFGIDESENLIQEAKRLNTDTEFLVGDMTKLPYKDSSFDIVLSKYAIGTVENVDKVFNEVNRVLKKGGMFAYLTTHPMRLLLEQKEKNRDYFIQKNVDLKVFGGKFTITEPSHTFNEFLSLDFIKNFTITSFSEEYDPQSADIPDREIYPDFFIVVAIKK